MSPVRFGLVVLVLASVSALAVVGCSPALGGCEGNHRLSVSPEQSCLEFERLETSTCGGVNEYIQNKCTETLVLETKYVSTVRKGDAGGASAPASGLTTVEVLPGEAVNMRPSPDPRVGRSEIPAKLGAASITFTLDQTTND